MTARSRPAPVSLDKGFLHGIFALCRAVPNPATVVAEFRSVFPEELFVAGPKCGALRGVLRTRCRHFVSPRDPLSMISARDGLDSLQKSRIFYRNT
jgi:hypothetical protein